MQSQTPSNVRRQSTVPATDKSPSINKKLKETDSDRQMRVWQPDDTGKYVKKRSSTPGNADNHNTVFRQGSPEYNPYKHRQPEAPVSNCFALLHIVKGSIGYGIWSMPNAFRSSGLLMSTVFMVLITALISYCVNLLMKMQYQLCKRRRVPYMSYGDAMQYAMEEGPDWMIRLSRESKTITNAVIVMFQWSACVFLMGWTVQLWKNVGDFYDCDVVSFPVLLSCLFILFFLLVCVPTLRTYSYFSALAFTLVIVCLVLITVHNFKQEWSPGQRSLVGHPWEWRRFIEVILVGMQSIGVTCSAERSMKKPEDFRGVFGVFNLALTTIVLVYWFTGTTGFLVYGEQTRGNIMAHMSMDDTWVQAVTFMQGIVTYLSFGLYIFPILDIVWNEYILQIFEHDSVKKQFIYNYALRLILVIICFASALGVGGYATFLLVVITIINVSLLVLVFPATMHICTLWPDDFGRFNWIYYKDLTLVLLGVLAMVLGMYNVVDDLIENGAGWKAPSQCFTSPSANETNFR